MLSPFGPMLKIVYLTVAILNQVWQIWAVGTPKVEVALYYQSYCPHSVTFIHDQVCSLSQLRQNSPADFQEYKLIRKAFVDTIGLQ